MFYVLWHILVMMNGVYVLCGLKWKTRMRTLEMVWVTCGNLYVLTYYIHIKSILSSSNSYNIYWCFHILQKTSQLFTILSRYKMWWCWINTIGAYYCNYCNIFNLKKLYMDWMRFKAFIIWNSINLCLFVNVIYCLSHLLSWFSFPYNNYVGTWKKYNIALK